MTAIAALDDLLAAEHLSVIGYAQDASGPLALIGPKEPGFWTHFKGSAEYNDGAADPMDRWSERVLNRIAGQIGSEALFPFGGPPFHPFYSWALTTGRVWQSPLQFLVDADAGLLLSYRGALRLDALPKPAPALQSPCLTCEGQPCRTACPVGALTPDGYNVALCKSYLDAVSDCRAGCQVRQACPVSQSYPRDPAQTRFHMEAFHPPCRSD